MKPTFLAVSFDVTISIPNAIEGANMCVDDAMTPTSACRWPRVRTPSRGGRARFLANRPHSATTMIMGRNRGPAVVPRPLGPHAHRRRHPSRPGPALLACRCHLHGERRHITGRRYGSQPEPASRIDSSDAWCGHDQANRRKHPLRRAASPPSLTSGRHRSCR